MPQKVVEGAPLPYLSHGSLASGFFTLRSGWKKDAAVMVVKAGPKGEWHCQPDNGTFEFWFNGKNLFRIPVRMFMPGATK